MHQIKHLHARMNELLDKYVMGTSIAGIGSGGQRHQRNAEQLRDVAASLLVDTDRGYNSRAGYALGGMPLDAGHVIGHASRPDLSDMGSNLEWENQYANKGKAATEKDGSKPRQKQQMQNLLKVFSRARTS